MRQDQEIICTDMRILPHGSAVMLLIIRAINYSRQCKIWQLSIAKPQNIKKLFLIGYEKIRVFDFLFLFMSINPMKRLNMSIYPMVRTENDDFSFTLSCSV